MTEIPDNKGLTRFVSKNFSRSRKDDDFLAITYLAEVIAIQAGSLALLRMADSVDKDSDMREFLVGAAAKFIDKAAEIIEEADLLIGPVKGMIQ